MIKYIKLIMIGWVFTLNSCDYLNVNPYFNDIISVDTVFARQEFLERYLWGTAGLLPTEGNLYYGSSYPYMTAVDESIMSHKKDEMGGAYLVSDEISSFSKYYNNWEKMYKGIRKANTILSRIDECRDLDLEARRDIMGMSYFLRGYFYYLLVLQYGPVPLLPTTVLDVSASNDDLAFPRSTYDECVEAICKDMESAAQYLPARREPSFLDRPTSGAALSVISRLRLYQASPLFNGNSYYANWSTEDGKHFINQEYDEEKWAKSAYTSKLIIKSGNYIIHTVPKSDKSMPVASDASQANFPDGVGGIDPFCSYAHMFTGETPAVLNTELIFSSTMSSNQKRLSFPARTNGWNYTNIPQKLVDAFYMEDGSDFNEGKFPIDGFYTGDAKIYRDYQLGGPKAVRGVHNMYMNREPRFYAIVGFCEAYWPATSAGVEQYEDFYTDYYSDGICGVNRIMSEDEVLITGYTCKKYIHPIDHPASKYQAVTYPVFRYAETLLNYVEAINEIDGTYTYGDSGNSENPGDVLTISRNVAEMVTYFNMIRYRAGLPGITDTDAADRDNMRKLIKRERMLEFAHEGRRYHDLRRWKDAFEEENKPVMGMNLNANTANYESFYAVTKITHKNAYRVFKHKMNFYPIPNGIIEKNRKIIQNQGW